MSKRRFILIGLGLLLVALVVAAVPRSEGYSSFGFGVVGNVEVECGSLFSSETGTDFSDYDEQLWYDEERRFGSEPRIFDGKSASEVCDDLHQTSRTVAILAAIVGVVLLGIGLSKKSADDAGDEADGPIPLPVAGDQDGFVAPSSPTPGGLADPGDLDSTTAQLTAGLAAARARFEPYLAPKLFLAASVVYLVAILQEEWAYSMWGSAGYLKGIVLVTGVAALVGLTGNNRYADLVAAIGSSYVLGDGVWRLVGGFQANPVWARVLVAAADVAIFVGLVQYLAERGRSADRRQAPPQHDRIVLIGCGIATLTVVLVGWERYYDDRFADIVYIFIFWVVFMTAVAAALLLRSADMLLFTAVAVFLRFVQLFMGWYDYVDGPWPTLAKLALAAVVGYAGWQWFVLRNADSVPAPAPPSGGSASFVAPAPAPAPTEVPSAMSSNVPKVEPDPPADVAVGTPTTEPLAIAPDVGRVRHVGIASVDGGPDIEFSRHLVVGRNPTAPDGIDDVVSRVIGDDFTISKTHVLIGVEDDEVWVEDLHSANGTLLVTGPEPTQLEPGMRRFLGNAGVIQIGESRISLMTRKEA